MRYTYETSEPHELRGVASIVRSPTKKGVIYFASNTTDIPPLPEDQVPVDHIQVWRAAENRWVVIEAPTPPEPEVLGDAVS